MYMLLLIDREEDGLVSGTWLQWCCACSLAEAEERARATEQANTNRIAVAVVDELYTSYPLNRYYANLKRLDKA